MARDLRERAREFDARRATADDGEGEQRGAARGIGFGFGAFEGGEDAAADRERIVERLQAGRVRRPFVVAEIRVRRARADEQRVVGDRRAVRELHAARGLVDADDLAHQHGDVALPAQDVAQRRGDVGRGQAGGRHLVKQGLEQMVVAAVDQRDPHLRTGERARGPQPRESASDDHDMGHCVH